MATNETKIDALRAAIDADIEQHNNIAKEAFIILEKIDPTTEEYKKANWQFGLNQYVAGYIRKIKELTIDSNLPIKCIENRIRFHAYQQHTKGSLDDKQEISAAQAAVAVILDSYVQQFFESRS